MDGVKENYWENKLSEFREASGKKGDRNVKWRKDVLEPWNSKTKYEDREYSNSSNIKIDELYTSQDLRKNFEDKYLGLPGSYPFTRGIYPNMYRGKLWTMRMFSGFGTPEDTNRRLKYLIEHGESGLSIAFDMPTLYGYDCDNKRADGEVGRCGVNVSSLRDMEDIFPA